MRRELKEQIIELTQTLDGANSLIQTHIKRKQKKELLTVLGDAQEAAVSIGNTIDASEGEGSRATKCLEEYCEALWQCSQAVKYPEQMRAVQKIQQSFRKAVDEIRQIKVKLEVVFFPYKASMWECMESVWMAADKDEECDAYVVPIPYFDIKNGQVTARHYEGDKFPPYVPIVSYLEYPLEKRRPDAAFIHNPFDRFNFVTSVLPDYYSAELKKYVNRLVYIPYFVTGVHMPPAHRELPSYYIVDYIVCQQEEMINSFASTIPREKFLPFGSPVADRIIRLKEQKPEIPEAWKPMLKNGRDFGTDKVVMLNTSITILMHDRERYLDKLEYIIHLAQRMKGITIVWRPHPLIETTAQTLGENFVRRLNDLKKFFLDNRVGVLDQTPDVGVTVALCDAYLGEMASSVIHMFGIARKPRFFINVLPGSETDVAAKYRVSGRVSDGEKEYFILNKYNWIIERNRNSGEMQPLAAIPDADICRPDTYRNIVIKGEKLYLPSRGSEGTFIYNIKNGGRLKKYMEDEEIKEDSKAEEISIPEHVLARIRAEEFRRENYNNIWQESDKYTLEDYFYYLLLTNREQLKGMQLYYGQIASLDGSCGIKVYQKVKENCKGSR